MTLFIQPPARAKIPWGLVGMLALVVAVEAVVAGHALDLTRFPIDDWRVQGRAARVEAVGRDWLCFGDSLVKYGIAPRELEARLGGRAYNLALCGGQAPASYFLLRRALDAGARPRGVIVDFAPHLLATDARHNLRQWPELLGLREGVDLAWTTGHAGFLASLALGGLLPTVKDREQVRGAIVAALRGESASRRGEVEAHRRTWRAERGAERARADPSYRGEIDAVHPAYFPHAWKCHRANEAYVRRFLDLADRHAIAVYWLLPPLAPRFQARRAALGLDDAYARLLAPLRARYANLVVVDGRYSGYGPADFIDPLHLNGQAARAWSASVASAIGRSRAVADGSAGSPALRGN